MLMILWLFALASSLSKIIGYGLDVQDLILVRGRVLSPHPFRPLWGPPSVLPNEYMRILPKTKRSKLQDVHFPLKLFM
jgi:hypothetical protein